LGSGHATRYGGEEKDFRFAKRIEKRCSKRRTATFKKKTPVLTVKEAGSARLGARERIRGTERT